MKGYEKQKQLVGVKRRGRKHHPTLPHTYPTTPPYHPTLPHTYHTPTTHLPKTYPTMHLPHTYPTCIYKHLNNNTYTEYQTINSDKTKFKILQQKTLSPIAESSKSTSMSLRQHKYRELNMEVKFRKKAK